MFHPLGHRDFSFTRFGLGRVDGEVAALFITVIIIDKRVVDADNALFQVNISPTKPSDLTDSHPRVCHYIEHRIPVSIFWMAEHIVKKQLLLSHRQRRFLLSLKAVRELQFFEHIVCRVLSNHPIIDRHLKDLVKHIMDIIYRSDLQHLAVRKRVVELSHIGLLHLDKSVLSERRFYKQLIHINIILECAVLDSPFELTPKIKHLIYGDAFDIRPYSVVLVHDDLFFLLSQLFQRRSINRMPFSVRR